MSDPQHEASAEEAELIDIDTVDYSGGTMGIATGDVLDADGYPTGERISIGIDWRPLRDIDLALEAGEEVVGEFESWQVTRRWTRSDQPQLDAAPRAAPTADDTAAINMLLRRDTGERR